LVGIAATVVCACALAPGTAGAGEVSGDLALSYTGTTDSWFMPPSRDDHRTYDPCSGAQRLVGMGGAVRESAPPAPNTSGFALGKAYTTGIEPFDQSPGAPVPDSTQHTADNLFKVDNDLQLVESTTCAESPGELSYPDAEKQSARRGRTSLKVACPGGKHVLSGGGVASGPFRSQRLVSSAPFDSGDAGSAPDDGWKVVVDNLKRKRRAITANAICSSVGGVSYESGGFRAKKRARKHVEIACPDGEFAISGGVSHRGPYGKATLVASILPVPFDGRGWVVEVDNLTRERTAGRAFAICHA
jgi:hypothetical protein